MFLYNKILQTNAIIAREIALIIPYQSDGATQWPARCACCWAFYARHNEDAAGARGPLIADGWVLADYRAQGSTPPQNREV